MNKVCLTGNLGKDVELKHTNSGLATCTMSLGVARPKNRNGESETDWISCVAWDKTAELADRYLHKGSKIGVEGHIQTRNYDGKDGKKVYVTEVVIDRMEFLSPKSDSGEQRSYSGNDNSEREPLSMQQTDDDELPF